MPSMTGTLLTLLTALALLAIDTSVAPAQTGKTFTLKFNHVLARASPIIRASRTGRNGWRSGPRAD